MPSEKHHVEEDLASDILAVIDILPRLVRGRHLGPGLQGIQVSIGPAGGDVKPGPNPVVYCKVTIEGDTAKDRDTIKAKFHSSEGWTCKNTGDKTAVCTNP